MRVPANQPTTNVLLQGDGQIDSAGTYAWPLPTWGNAVVEGTSNGSGGYDHHILILQSSVNNITGPQSGACKLYETYQSTSVPSMFDAGSNTWAMGAGVHYVLNTNEIAASESFLDTGAQDSPGIPMVPLLLRYSDVPQLAQHPLRITMAGSTNWFVWPATGCCSGSGAPQGLLYRLKGSVNWQATCPASSNPQAATLLQTLQQYGAYMSDHGSNGYIQGVPDIRWNDDDLACIKRFHLSDLEIVNNSVLEVSDISGQTKPYVVPATLSGGKAGNSYNFTFSAIGGNPATQTWSVSSGALPPGLVLNTSTGAISGLINSSAAGSYSFNITARDTSSGYSSAAQVFSITVTNFMVGLEGGSPPAPVATTVTSLPAGLTVTVDGASYITPQSFNWLPGSAHVFSTHSPQGSGTRYVFANWSDRGAASHTIVVPATASTYTANFVAQCLLTPKSSPGTAGFIDVVPSSIDGYYDCGTAVQVTAMPTGGRRLSGFSGDVTGRANPQSLVMSGPRSVTANFAPLPRFSAGLRTYGILTRGQANAAYAITVANESASATSGEVTVSETPPAGMTLVSMAGPGWTCSRGGHNCSRSDSLNGGASYPPITMTVNIPANAGPLQFNSLTVSGGGAAAMTAAQLIVVVR